MKLKVKYQYTYFIYPYIIEEKKYNNYIYKLLKDKNCKLKLFDSQKNIGIEKYFLPEIKEKLFWSIYYSDKALREFNNMDIKMKANILAQKDCNIFEYNLKKDIPGKIIESDGIFFDISKVEIVCFKTGICFLLLKTVLTEQNSFSDVLNFNYKFKNINSKIGQESEFNRIKIQTSKLNNMQSFTEFMEEIVGNKERIKAINVDTNELITYSYTCLDQNSLKENGEIIKKEFEKYRQVKPEEEQKENVVLKDKYTYRYGNSLFGFSPKSVVLLTYDDNIKNYTKLLEEFETEMLYQYIFNLYKKIYLKKINYEFKNVNKFEIVKDRFLKFIKKDWIYEVSTSELGRVLEQYYIDSLDSRSLFLSIKQEYDLYFKEYTIRKKDEENTVKILVVSTIIVTIILIYIIFKMF